METSQCKRRLARMWFLGPALGCLIFGLAWSVDSNGQNLGGAVSGTKTTAAPAAEISGSDAKEGDAWENRWFVKGGLANVHARLEESEDDINRQLNRPFSVLIPGWDRARTFKDLSKNWGLFDAHLALGRDINENGPGSLTWAALSAI